MRECPTNTQVPESILDPETQDFFRRMLVHLNAEGVGYLVGGAYALNQYTGLERHTRDLDVFVRPGDAEACLASLERAGCRTEFLFPHWLGKAYRGDRFVDVIYSSGNGIARVDDAWFDHSETARLLDVEVRICPPEEMVWSKGYIMERERYDGNDVLHILRALADRLDWARLLDRFGEDWRVLFTHVLLFGFVYPGERDRIPRWVVDELTSRLQRETANGGGDPARLCRGPLLSRVAYVTDLERWGYEDARLDPRIRMTEAQIDLWVRAGTANGGEG